MKVLPVRRPCPDGSDDETFFGLAGAISNIDQRYHQKTPMLEAVSQMHRTQSDHAAFLEAFQQFMTAAAQYPAVISPFLPALLRMIRERP